METMAADVGAVLTLLELRDIVLVGHSMGALLAILTVLEHDLKKRIVRLVSLAGSIPRATASDMEPWGMDDAAASGVVEAAKTNYPELLNVFRAAIFQRGDMEARRIELQISAMSSPP